MSGRSSYSLDGRLYRAALSLCPAGFRVEHGDELARDFDEGRGEAAATRNRELWSFRLLMAIDLVRTFVVQWFRTGVPATALASAILALTLAARSQFQSTHIHQLAALVRNSIPTLQFG